MLFCNCYPYHRVRIAWITHVDHAFGITNWKEKCFDVLIPKKLALILCHNFHTYLHCPISSAVVKIFSSWAFKWRDAAVWSCHAIPLQPSSVFLKLTLNNICLISPRSDQLSRLHQRISYSWNNLKHVSYSLRWFNFSTQFILTVFDCCCLMKKTRGDRMTEVLVWRAF